jgi:hypothetical protein
MYLSVASWSNVIEVYGQLVLGFRKREGEREREVASSRWAFVLACSSYRELPVKFELLVVS